MIKNKEKFNWRNLIFDILAIIIIAAAFYPILRWYYQAHPPLGVDFYQLPTYSRYLADHLTWPAASWKYIWFNGLPTITDYAGFFLYLSIPFTKIWGLVAGSKIFMILMTFILHLFIYFLLKELSRSRWFALAGTIAFMWTMNLYEALMFGGNTTYSATTLFLPLVFWMIIKYFHTQKRRFFFLAVLFAGLSFWGHVGLTLLFVWIPGLIFLFFWRDEKKVKFFSWKKIKDTFFYLFGSMGIGFLALYALVFLALTIPFLYDFTLFGTKATIHPEALKQVFVAQNIFLCIGTIAIIILAISRNYLKDFLKKLLPYIALVGYLLFTEWLYAIGRHPLGGAITPIRTFWFLAFLMLITSAVCWDLAFNKFKKLKSIIGPRIITFRLTQVLIILILFLAPIGSLAHLNKKVFGETYGFHLDLSDYTDPTQGTFVQSTLGTDLLGANSLALENLSVDDILAQKKITQADKNKLIGYLIPVWMNPDELNYRFHTLQVGVNIWWSALFNMPLTHGAYDSSHYESNDYNYWTDAAIHGELVTHWNTPIEIAKNDSLFLIDWRAIRYLFGEEKEIKEKGEYSVSESISTPSVIASYLTKDFNIVDRKGIKDIPIDQLKDGGTEGGALTYFRIKDSVVSPIIKTTNAPSILIIGDDRLAYENIIRDLAHLNLNSRFVVPVKGPESLNKVSQDDLKKFDIVFLQYYKAGNNGWQKLEKYVQSGGNLIVDTGGDVKESDTKKQNINEELPAVFPIKQTARGALGQDWNLSYSAEEPLLKDVNTKEFGPLKYEGGPWNISYAEVSSIRSWAHVILNQNDKPFLVAGQLGQGKVVWSGLNLSYHYNQYFSQAEGQLLKNILGSMIDLKDEGTLDFKVDRPKPEKVVIEGSNFKGAVLKENNYGGWSARMLEPYKKKLKVFKAGLGYSYVQLPSDVSGQAKVEFNYRGTAFNWFFFLLAIIISIWLVGKSLIEVKRFRILEKINIFGFIKKKLKKQITIWWDKEEE